MRSIKHLIHSEKVNMGGIWLQQALPVAHINQIDPFLLIHHWREDMPGGQHQSKVGVGPHPHRGFAPVTMIFEGSVHHRDSLGFNSVVDAGGTQWMNSGKGIIHSERPSVELSNNGGLFEIIQFWVNAPRKHKLDAPFYQPLSETETPRMYSEDQLISAGLVAGELMGHKSPIETYSPMLILRLDFNAGGRWKIPVPADFNALIYVLDGGLRLSGQDVIADKQMAWFDNDGDAISLVCEQPGRAILLAGAPLNEPVVNYGPFVLNTEHELMQAVQDFQDGKMGSLKESF